ncbi:MAG: 4-hydroxy-3-methylbut-2-enyl diphosphate reductase [Lachnospiraceae bacterium]|nr:4-hydroxy-3-methylbut-2-enyl diphosphate reductase [Lachnospiraceae bacterium]
MEIILAKTAGFCFGVKRAVDQVYEQLKQKKPIYTYGPIIHNEEVVRDLVEKGVRIIETEEELAALRNGVVIIRSHGVPERIITLLKEKGLEYIDMTCPFVKRIHEIVSKESVHSHIVIIGNPGHPEVEGIRGWSKTPAAVIATKEEACLYDLEEYGCRNGVISDKNGQNHPVEQSGKTGSPICIVSQTTFNYNKFQELIEIFIKKGYDINIMNTICDATRKRQAEAKEIASDADIMIVVGDTQSSNSRKLYEICRQECTRTYFVQTSRDLELKVDDTVRKIGITAGASTPNNIIEEVQNYVRSIF